MTDEDRHDPDAILKIASLQGLMTMVSLDREAVLRACRVARGHVVAMGDPPEPDARLTVFPLQPAGRTVD